MKQTMSVPGRPDNSPAGTLLKGAVDMHVHFAPALQPRRQTALEVALTARANNMKGVVLKNPHYPTGPLAALVSEVVRKWLSSVASVLNMSAAD